MEHEQIRIFVQNVKRDGFRLEIQRFRPRHLQPDAVTGFDLLTWPDRLAIDENAPFSDQALQGRTREGWVAVGKEDIDPLGRFSSGHDNFNRSVTDSIHVVTA